jgi:hypothetical protein
MRSPWSCTPGTRRSETTGHSQGPSPVSQTPPRQPCHQWERQLTGSSRGQSRLGTCHFPPYTLPLYSSLSCFSAQTTPPRQPASRPVSSPDASTPSSLVPRATLVGLDKATRVDGSRPGGDTPRRIPEDCRAAARLGERQNAPWQSSRRGCPSLCHGARRSDSDSQPTRRCQRRRAAPRQTPTATPASGVSPVPQSNANGAT